MTAVAEHPLDPGEVSHGLSRCLNGLKHVIVRQTRPWMQEYPYTEGGKTWTITDPHTYLFDDRYICQRCSGVVSAWDGPFMPKSHDHNRFL